MEEKKSNYWIISCLAKSAWLTRCQPSCLLGRYIYTHFWQAPIKNSTGRNNLAAYCVSLSPFVNTGLDLVLQGVRGLEGTAGPPGPPGPRVSTGIMWICLKSLPQKEIGVTAGLLSSRGVWANPLLGFSQGNILTHVAEIYFLCHFLTASYEINRNAFSLPLGGNFRFDPAWRRTFYYPCFSTARIFQILCGFGVYGLIRVKSAGARGWRQIWKMSLYIGSCMCYLGHKHLHSLMPRTSQTEL